jgi:hypothetical protein
MWSSRAFFKNASWSKANGFKSLKLAEILVG